MLNIQNCLSEKVKTLSMHVSSLLFQLFFSQAYIRATSAHTGTVGGNAKSCHTTSCTQLQ